MTTVIAGEEHRNCSICYETKDNMNLTKCNHLFCEECLVKWLKMNKKCPNCRTSLDLYRCLECNNYNLGTCFDKDCLEKRNHDKIISNLEQEYSNTKSFLKKMKIKAEIKQRKIKFNLKQRFIKMKKEYKNKKTWYGRLSYWPLQFLKKLLLSFYYVLTLKFLSRDTQGIILFLVAFGPIIVFAALIANGILPTIAALGFGTILLIPLIVGLDMLFGYE